jgi:hypothetical protein
MKKMKKMPKGMGKKMPMDAPMYHSKPKKMKQKTK